jgi:hypothetical protein
MLYAFLGRVVWRLARRYLRRRLQRGGVPKPLVGGALGGIVVGVLLSQRKRLLRAARGGD